MPVPGPGGGGGGGREHVGVANGQEEVEVVGVMELVMLWGQEVEVREGVVEEDQLRGRDRVMRR